MVSTKVEQCSSCKTSITNVHGTARFACPSCTKEQIVRCERCRRFAARYTCPSCKFEGPN